MKKEVDPGQGDGDGTYLPLEARTLLPDKMVASDKESKAVDKGVKEEDSWQVTRSCPLECPQLVPDWLELLSCKEEYKSGYVQQKKNDPEVLVEVCQPIGSTSFLLFNVGIFIELLPLLFVVGRFSEESASALQVH